MLYFNERLRNLRFFLHLSFFNGQWDSRQEVFQPQHLKVMFWTLIYKDLAKIQLKEMPQNHVIYIYNL